MGTELFATLTVRTKQHKQKRPPHDHAKVTNERWIRDATQVVVVVLIVEDAAGQRVLGVGVRELTVSF